jgi:hypothetical protein
MNDKRGTLKSELVCHSAFRVHRCSAIRMKELTVVKSMFFISVVVLLMGLAMAKITEAQQKPEERSEPSANPADVASMDAILAALYDVISGPAGKPRDWDRMRSLFVPGARLIPTGPRPEGGFGARVLNVDEYITRSSAFFEKEGFYERESARRTEQFGQIAHVFSTYEARHNATDRQPFLRGINSIQLMNDGKRWWVVTVFWQAEDKNHPLPKKYLKSKKDK